MSVYYDSDYDRILLTCSIPTSYRGDGNKISHLATQLCALVVTTRIAPTWDNSKVAWVVLDDLFAKGFSLIAVFLVGDRPKELPEPKGELNLDDLLKEGGDGQQGSPPQAPE